MMEDGDDGFDVVEEDGDDGFVVVEKDVDAAAGNEAAGIVAVAAVVVAVVAH